MSACAGAGCRRPGNGPEREMKMALANLFPISTVGADHVSTFAVIIPKGAGTPVLSYGPACSGIVRDGAAEYTLTLRQPVAYAFGGGLVNRVTAGGVNTFVRFDHTAGSAAIKLYFTDETGAAVDLDLTGGGYVYVPFTVKQNPAVVF